VLAFEDPVAAVFVPPDRAPARALRLETLPEVVSFPGEVIAPSDALLQSEGR
jgi:hypothetical protein